MINRLLAYLTGAVPERPLPDADGKHLIGCLAVRLAQADGVLHIEELRFIDALFVKLYRMNPVDAAKLRAESERLSLSLPETSELGPLLSNTLSPEERSTLLTALYGLAKVDGELEDREAQVIAAISALLDQDGADSTA